jgi:glycosyltransferase involved in cell wall biosynthesis
LVSADAEYDIVMLALNDLAHDSRVLREAQALAEVGWRVVAIGAQRADGRLPDREQVSGFDLWRVRYGRFGAGLWRPWRWIRHGLQAQRLLRAVMRVETRAYHAHDFPALIVLSLARALRRRRQRRRGRIALVYDAHELYLFQTRYRSRLARFWHRLTRPLFMRLEGYLARRADAIVTVSDPIARLMARWHRVPRPVVILNAIDPPGDRATAPIDLRALAGGRYMVHTGRITSRGRCLTELIRALAFLPGDMRLVFLGPDVGGETTQLRAEAERLGIGGRVRIAPPVPPDQVATAIQSADAAAVLMRPDSLNMRAALPVKLFEAIAAGVPVVASNQFALARMVTRYGLGVVCDPDDPGAIAAAWDSALLPDFQVACRARVRRAQTALNWRNEAAKLRVLYERILSKCAS